MSQLVDGERLQRARRAEVVAGGCLWSCLIHFHVFNKCCERVVPEAIDPGTHRSEAVLVDPVEPAGTEGTDADEPGFPQDSEVLRDSGLRDAHVVGELPDAPLSVAKQLEYLAPGGFRERVPYWVIDGTFDLDFHVRHLGLPPPGDFTQLQTQVARLAARPLDQSRPLWEAYVIDGLPDDRFALFMKVHHATVDGAAGAEMLGRLTDTEPGADRSDLQVPLTPADRVPSSMELLTRGSVSMLFEPARLVRFQAKMIKDLADSSRSHGLKSVVDAAARAVPGPIGQLARNWADDTEDSPVSTLIEGQGLNITVQSYVDSLDLGLVACADLVPDLDRLADLLVNEIETFGAALEAAS
jgi:hypothetical protein